MVFTANIVGRYTSFTLYVTYFQVYYYFQVQAKHQYQDRLRACMCTELFEDRYELSTCPTDSSQQTLFSKHYKDKHTAVYATVWPVDIQTR